MIDSKLISDLRARTGCGIVECKKVLEANGGDVEKAAEELRKKGMAKADSRGARATKEGLVHCYMHPNNKMGVLVEIQCETDFVARTDGFVNFVHDVAMQIAATNPRYISSTEVPADVVAKERDIVMAEFVGSTKPAEVIAKIAEGKIAKFYSEICLLNQGFIKEEEKTIETLLKEQIAKTGENMKIVRFARFELSESPATC